MAKYKVYFNPTAEKKFYAPGIGFILVIDLETGTRSELVEITNP